MSGIEQENEEDKDHSRYRSRKAIHSAVQETCEQSSDNTAYQETVIDHNNEQVDFESKETQLKEELVKHLPKTVKAKLSEAESFSNSLQAITTRCELLIKFTDRAQLIPDIDTKTDTPSFQDLLSLLQMYRNGLAQLLKERCYYFLTNANREEASSYAEQLTNLADTLLDKDLKDEAKIILSSDGLLTTMFLQQKHEHAQTEIKEFLERLESDSQKRAEYAVFFMLYYNHTNLCNMQEGLDSISECLKIACGLEDEEMMIDTVSRMAHIYQILGKYKASYDILAEVLKFQIDNVAMKCRALNNFSVTALLIKKKEESLDFAKKSLEVAKATDNKSYMACAYGNIGLAKEGMGQYSEAFEPYRECLKLGLKYPRDERVINNSYCNLGRAHEGLGEKDKAREYYKKAVDTPPPRKSHWCDTDEMRFSGDFRLAKLAVSEKNWQEAESYLQQVIKRCKTLRKSVQDSSIKITFNDTQRKPYQYLQHVLLEKGEKENALFVAEQGRARDFYDKFAQEENDQVNCLNTPQALLDFAKSQNISVLFLSTLEVVDKLCGWFISPDGSIETFSTSQSEWEEVLTELCTVMYLLQGRHVVEFRGVEEREDEDERDAYIQEAFNLVKKVNRGSTEEISVSADVREYQQADCQHETNSARNQGATKMEESCLASETRSGFTNASTSELLNNSQSGLLHLSGSEEVIQHYPNSARNQGATRMGKSCLASENKSGFTNASTSELLGGRQSDRPQASGTEEGIQHHPDPADVCNVQQGCQPQTSNTSNQGATRMGDSYLTSKNRSGFKKTTTSGVLGHSHSDHLHLSVSEEGIFTAISASEVLEGGQSDHLQFSGTEERIQDQQDSDNRKSLSLLIDKLSDLVLKPIEQQLEKLIGDESVEKPRLLVIPQGKSFNIPYAALRLKNNQPLCSQVTILEAFSFHSFFNSIKQHEKSKDDIQDLRDALIVGNPTNDLPWAEREAKQIAKFLKVTALIGDSATYREVLSRLSDHRIIHFACHGELSKNSLQLAPVQNEQGTSGSKHEAILTVADIEKVKIRADMVVLSACHTARGKINSEGVLGLARAFLVSGAKSVVTALWAIPDKGTKHFMKKFYLNLSDGQPVAEALCKTMCQIRVKENYKDVINWGAFKVYGHNGKVVFSGNLAL